jgi:hypothetical protein
MTKAIFSTIKMFATYSQCLKLGVLASSGARVAILKKPMSSTAC